MVQTVQENLSEYLFFQNQVSFQTKQLLLPQGFGPVVNATCECRLDARCGPNSSQENAWYLSGEE